MICLEQKVSKDIDGLLAALARDGLELRVRPRTEEEEKERKETELNEKQKKKVESELITFYESIKGEIGNHVYGRIVYVLGAMELQISDLREDPLFEIKNRPLMISGENVGETCDHCYYRLTCLTQTENMCELEEDDFDEEEESENFKIRQHFRTKHSVAFNRDTLIHHLKQHGFKPEPVFKGHEYAVETTWYKDNLRVCF